MSQRFKLVIEYDGHAFCGWQSQPAGCGVQDALARAFMAFCGEQVVIFGAGRTDAGVHAYGQTAHVDVAKPTNADELRQAINFHLKPQPVAICAARPVADSFDARFSARERHYCYRIINRSAPLTLAAGRAWWVPVELNVKAMQQAAQVFVGQHDFTTFRSRFCQADSPVKTINKINVTRRDNLIEINVSARSFLHHQVRSFVGALKLVGEGKWSAEKLQQVLDACDRSACAPVAPPEGLYFMRVDYPAENEK